MSCHKPLEAYKDKSGAITFTRSRSLTKVSFQVPCGRCVGCRLEKSRQWAMRCLHEAKVSKYSSFLTLTYDNEFLPPGGSLVLRDLQLFLKRLRKAREPERLRYYACGEYGEVNARPHYHLLLFDCIFPDRLRIGSNKRGEQLFASKEVRGLWPYGFNVIGDVTFDSAAYVARYVMKKVTGDGAADHYSVVDGDGVVYDRVPEFAVMSRRPGIGSGFYDKYGSEIRNNDSVVINGRCVRPPRFYDSRTDRDFEGLMFYQKRERKAQSVLNRADNTPERLRVKEELARRTLNLKQRRV